jgi:hypothetical protein
MISACKPVRLRGWRCRPWRLLHRSSDCGCAPIPRRDTAARPPTDARAWSGIRASHKPAAERDCDSPGGRATQRNVDDGDDRRPLPNGTSRRPWSPKSARNSAQPRASRWDHRERRQADLQAFSWRRIARDDSLKIVVSPVRVRVSPSDETPAHWHFRGSESARQLERQRATKCAKSKTKS